jgi:hypothetical protein
MRIVKRLWRRLRDGRRDVIGEELAASLERQRELLDQLRDDA